MNPTPSSDLAQAPSPSAAQPPAAPASAWRLTRNAFGQLVLHLPDGSCHVDVLPVRAFPVAAPDEGISLVSAQGHELVWIERLSTLEDGLRASIAQALQAREFMPEILRLRAVSSFATPSQWEVDTDHGACSFTLKGEEDIRRLSGGLLLIADAHGVQYLLRRVAALDRHSRKLLDRFL